ncbi:MAG: metallophosphoesterase family protein [Desulfobia sp.]
MTSTKKEKTFVIGDIHGCYGALTRLLEKIDPDPERDTLVFLGDYIDRGPDSSRVISKVIELSRTFRRLVPLKGNHEEMFLSWLAGRDDQDLYLQIGGTATLKSYGIMPPYDRNDNKIPAQHINFIRELLLLWEDNQAIYVHAGLKPGVHLSMQPSHWCCWARGEFYLSNHDFGKKIVFGHTPFPDEPFQNKEKIGIDTGAVYGGRLTCLILPDMEFVSVPGYMPP